MSDPRPPAHFGLPPAALALAVGLVTFLLFAPALRNELVSWDDWDNLTHNEHYRGLDPGRLAWMFTTTHAGHYQPLSWLTLAVDYLWGRAVFGDGLDPRSYHLTNLLLHACNAALVFLIAVRLLRAIRRQPAAACPSGAGMGDQRAAAVLTALLFAWHPLRVESVVWATERRDVLSSFFLLLSVLCYLRAPLAPPRRRWRFLGLALATFALSLLSRSLAVVLPPILLLLDWYPLRRFAPAAETGGVGRHVGLRSALLEKLPFFALAAGFAGLAVHSQAATRAAYSLAVYPLLPRLVQTCYGLCFYVAKTLVPVRLSAVYELQIPANVLQVRYVAAAAAVLVALGVLLWLLRRRRGRWLVVAACAYALFIVPVAGVVQSGKQEVADRYSYLPGVILALLAAAGVRRAMAAPAAGKLAQRALGVAAGGATLLLGGLTVAQCAVWRDSESLWAHAARVQPDSSIAHCEYGTVLVSRRDYVAALTQLYRAVELWPGNTLAHRQIWRAWAEQGPSRVPELLAALQHSVELLPEFPDAHYELAWELAECGQEEAAMAEYRATLDRDPTHSRAHTNLAVLLKKQGQTAEALRHYQAGALANRQNLYAWRGWALLLHELGRDSEALDALRVALQVDPNDPRSRGYLQEWTSGANTAASSAPAPIEAVMPPADPARAR